MKLLYAGITLLPIPLIMSSDNNNQFRLPDHYDPAIHWLRTPGSDPDDKDFPPFISVPTPLSESFWSNQTESTNILPPAPPSSPVFYTPQTSQPSSMEYTPSNSGTFSSPAYHSLISPQSTPSQPYDTSPMSTQGSRYHTIPFAITMPTPEDMRQHRRTELFITLKSYLNHFCRVADQYSFSVLKPSYDIALEQLCAKWAFLITTDDAEERNRCDPRTTTITQFLKLLEQAYCSPQLSLVYFSTLMQVPQIIYFSQEENARMIYRSALLKIIYLWHDLKKKHPHSPLTIYSLQAENELRSLGNYCTAILKDIENPLNAHQEMPLVKNHLESLLYKTLFPLLSQKTQEELIGVIPPETQEKYMDNSLRTNNT